jgi:hypothetical protein
MPVRFWPPIKRTKHDVGKLLKSIHTSARERRRLETDSFRAT